MKAAYIEQTGPPDNIIYGDLPRPEPQNGEVLVRVKAVSVNPIDTYLRNGANYWPLPQPYIIGCDLAGEVVARGPAAQRFQVGDRVWGSNQGLLGRQGTFAEFCAVDEQWLYPSPPEVDDSAVAACAGRHHRSSGVISASSTSVGRKGLPARRCGWRRCDGRPDGQGGWRPGVHNGGLVRKNPDL